jgi:CRP-like cAMP-binding protein
MTASAERSSFGELGLLEGRLRSASILAETKLQCLVIRRDAFEATIKAVYRAEFDLKVKTLRLFSALRSSSDAFLKRLQIYTNLVTLSARAPIYRKGDKLSVVYLIISGGFALNFVSIEGSAI